MVDSQNNKVDAVGTLSVTVEQYAEMHNISQCTVYRLVRTEQLDSIRFGRSIRIPANALPVVLAPKPTKQSGLSFKERLKLLEM